MSMFKISAIVCGAALVAASPMAVAATARCSVNISSHFCRTGTIPANPNGPFVHVSISGPCEGFYVQEWGTGVIVYSGSTGWSGHSKTFPTLRADYYLSIYGGTWPITSGYIDN